MIAIKVELVTEECDMCGVESEIAQVEGEYSFSNICEPCIDRMKATFAPTYEAPTPVTAIDDLQKQIDALKDMLLTVTDVQDAAEKDAAVFQRNVNHRFEMVAGLKS